MSEHLEAADPRDQVTDKDSSVQPALIGDLQALALSLGVHPDLVFGLKFRPYRGAYCLEKINRFNPFEIGRCLEEQASQTLQSLRTATTNYSRSLSASALQSLRQAASTTTSLFTNS